MLKNKKLLAGIVISLLIIAIPISITFLGRQQDIRQRAASSNSNFKVLIDTNQINAQDAENGARFAADGTWSIPSNSPAGVNWSYALPQMGSAKWSVSEDNPGSTSQVDLVSLIDGKIVDGAMFYNEDGAATPLSDGQINAYAIHNVPGFGPLGNRIIVLTRSYGTQDTRRTQMDHAVSNPNVSGGAFEFAAGDVNQSLDFAAGCQHIISLGKKCYILIPPAPNTTNYLSDVQKVVNYFSSSGLLASPNLYFVPAVYVQPNSTHFLNTTPTDPNSIENLINWFNTVRNIAPPAQAAPPVNSNPTNNPPVGYLDGVDNASCSINGWTADPDDKSKSLTIHVYKDGSGGNQPGTIIGAYPANVPRADINAAGYPGNHAYVVVFDASSGLMDGRAHTIYVYGIDSADSNAHTLLANSGKTITCTAPAGPTPTPTSIPTPTATSTPIPTPSPTSIRATNTPAPAVVICPLRTSGDANCDGVINTDDFNIWRNEFLSFPNQLVPTIPPAQNADFNSDGYINTDDFNIWRTHFLSSLH